MPIEVIYIGDNTEYNKYFTYGKTYSASPNSNDDFFIEKDDIGEILRFGHRFDFMTKEKYRNKLLDIILG